MNIHDPAPRGANNEPLTPFEWIGGETAVKRMVERFYDLMDLEPQFAALRAAHGAELENARERLFMFLCGWLGGPTCTLSASDTPVCACGTCRFRSASKSVMSGWRV